MGKKLSVYLSDEAVANLGDIQNYLQKLTGCLVSRSQALNSLLVKGAWLFLDNQENGQRVVRKYLPAGDTTGDSQDE